MNDNAVLSLLERALLERIPARVKELGIRDSVYCLRIWYYGTDIDGDRSPSLTLKTDALRETIIVEKGELAPQCIWGADEYDRGRGVINVRIEDTFISGLCAEWFQQLPDRLLPDDNDLLPLRGAIQRVAKELNRIDWREHVNCTDDFIVFAADGSHSFGGDYEEMVASVPTERMDDFRSRSLLGPIRWWTLRRDEAS